MPRLLTLALLLILPIACKPVYVSQCKWARELRMPEPLKTEIIEFIEGQPDDGVLKFQGRQYFGKVAQHNQNVMHYCYE